MAPNLDQWKQPPIRRPGFFRKHHTHLLSFRVDDLVKGELLVSANIFGLFEEDSWKLSASAVGRSCSGSAGPQNVAEVDWPNAQVPQTVPHPGHQRLQPLAGVSEPGTSESWPGDVAQVDGTDVGPEGVQVERSEGSEGRQRSQRPDGWERSELTLNGVLFERFGGSLWGSGFQSGQSEWLSRVVLAVSHGHRRQDGCYNALQKTAYSVTNSLWYTEIFKKDFLAF